jgi:hypothetical protein
MKKLFCVLAFLPSILLSQTMENRIADSICYKLSKLDLSNSLTDLNNKAIQTIQETYIDFQEEINQLITEQKKIQPSLSNTDISNFIGQSITLQLMGKCENYQRITMFQNNPIPNISNITMKVGEEFTALLLDEMKTKEISYDLVNQCIIISTEKYSSEIEEEFGDRYSMQFISEFKAYLMTKSLPYMKWTASMVK